MNSRTSRSRVGVETVDLTLCVDDIVDNGVDEQALLLSSATGRPCYGWAQHADAEPVDAGAQVPEIFNLQVGDRLASLFLATLSAAVFKCRCRRSAIRLADLYRGGLIFDFTNWLTSLTRSRASISKDRQDRAAAHVIPVSSILDREPSNIPTPATAPGSSFQGRRPASGW
jgi:hypothetical protein